MEPLIVEVKHQLFIYVSPSVFTNFDRVQVYDKGIMVFDVQDHLHEAMRKAATWIEDNYNLVEPASPPALQAQPASEQASEQAEEQIHSAWNVEELSPAGDTPMFGETFSEREQGLIQNCIDYESGRPSGMPGHALALVIAKLARAYSVQQDLEIFAQIRAEKEKQAGLDEWKSHVDKIIESQMSVVSQ
ncbi:MAG: hypothetical protein ACYSWP_07085 [Planctomycetota bacterium]|jgi:hypothetical protein